MESSATTQNAKLGQGVARPDESRYPSFGLCQDPAVRPDLAAASPPSAFPGTLETTHHDCQAQFACEWLSESDQSVCGKLLCCKTAPDHFKVHGIFRKSKKDKIPWIVSTESVDATILLGTSASRISDTLGDRKSRSNSQCDIIMVN
ncbi:hypothetical protein BDN67DRAFT_1005291 [Paxillus ammoniavirescens]|nr:hypothetical protein BDN67DRAFT_1005291 [Paxillus ammoniavirescens]